MGSPQAEIKRAKEAGKRPRRGGGPVREPAPGEDAEPQSCPSPPAVAGGAFSAAT